jgi:starvation-inducible DNA-binding protein
MAKENGKSVKKIKSTFEAPSAGEGTVPTKGEVPVAQESGGRNSPIINIGIERQDRAAIAEGLSRVLADTYTLYLTTHNFHWNVTGPMFRTLHLLFEEQYTELATAVDSIAERIRALGFPAPGTYSTYARLSSIQEEPGVPDAAEMIKQLVDGQEAVVRTARSLFPLLEKVSDEPTADLLTQRLTVHEQAAWMLRANLEA